MAHTYQIAEMTSYGRQAQGEVALSNVIGVSSVTVNLDISEATIEISRLCNPGKFAEFTLIR